jgi:hypothetical protein
VAIDLRSLPDGRTARRSGDVGEGDKSDPLEMCCMNDTMTTSSLIAEARALVDAATPGPWSAEHHDGGSRIIHRGCDVLCYGDTPNDEANANLAAASRTLVPALLDALEAAQRENERMMKYVAHNDEEYQVMKDVLRAEHQACCALRAEIATLRDEKQELCKLLDEAKDKECWHELQR